MKLKTLQKYIKYTNIPYHDIYKRAEKAGMKVTYTPSAEKGMIVAIAYGKNNHFVSSCFPKAKDDRDKCCANWNEYSF